MPARDAERTTQWCFFDIDGVLVHECGVAYAGYWLQLEALRTGTIPGNYAKFLEIPSDVKCQIDSLRPRVKGLHFSRKLEKIRAYLVEAGESVVDLTTLNPVILVKAVMEVQRAYIQHHFPPENYRVPNSEDLLRNLSEDFSICTLTANDFEQTSWILRYVGLNSYFAELLCYQADAPGLQTKEDLLKDFQVRHPDIDFTQCIVLGDGMPDIRAGAAMGCFTVGICKDSDDFEKLAEANLLVNVGDYAIIPAKLQAHKSFTDGSGPLFTPRYCSRPCDPNADCTVEFSCQQKNAPQELSAYVIWDVAYNETEVPLGSIRRSTEAGLEAVCTYRVRIPLGSTPRSAVTNVGMMVLRSGAAVTHRQLFRVAYVAENAVTLQLL
ncbi:Hypothetical protein GLP15_469 [Giardia lamblia P15]|uniref:Uncharacterized protein n=1 Tax=Giardia intestinalis (strain P15) TaxID=658858 RepID=E1F6H8_GIAIA|nr:Hypothetical protein GLP15_469 [Giardia lamblia P15]